MNLRKDHCRNLHSRTTREHVQTPGEPRGVGRSGAAPRVCPSPPLRGGQTNPGAESAKEYSNESPPPVPRPRGVRADACFFRNQKRLSATDISALASMKNVAKCDTWCELQNPVNHRVFERKLRPKPSGRGHVCLGVTHRVAPRTPLGVAGADTGLPCASRPRPA